MRSLNEIVARKVKIHEVMDQMIEEWGFLYLSDIAAASCNDFLEAVKNRLAESGFIVSNDELQEVYEEKLGAESDSEADGEEEEEGEIEVTTFCAPLVPESNKKGLELAEENFISENLKLDGAYCVGQAVDNGGCFFHALAQILNESESTDAYNEKNLRLLCYEYFLYHQEEVVLLISSDFNKNGFSGDYSDIRYTQEELQDGSAIWGRSAVEGVILCRVLRDKLPDFHVVELIADPESKNNLIQTTTCQKITADGVANITFGEMDAHFLESPSLVVSQNGLHFVPIVKKVTLTEQNSHLHETKKRTVAEESEPEPSGQKRFKCSFFEGGKDEQVKTPELDQGQFLGFDY